MILSLQHPFISNCRNQFDRYELPFFFSILESPAFVIKPKNVTENVGKPVWIDCSGTGTPRPIVSYHRPKEIELNKTHFVTLPNGTLFIKELVKEDRGPYFCWLTQRQRIVAESFWITVLGMFYFAF